MEPSDLVNGPRHQVKQYKLGPEATRSAFAVELPISASVLAVGHKPGGPCLWVIGCVEPAWPTEVRYFTVLPTGENLPFEVRRLQHVGSYWTEDRPEAWHVFEILDLESLSGPFAEVAEGVATAA